MSTVLDAVRDYLRRGWQPVPIPRGSKRPVDREWQRGRYGEDAFPSGGNVGLALGAPSGGLVDVDLDCPEAQRMAEAFLPSTGMVHGRASARRSHYWYVAAGIEATTRLKAPDGATLVELRATGGQTVVPPSVHPCAEELAWAGELEPARVDPGALRGAVERLAAAAVLARAWPGPGGRHDAFLALAGVLLQGGVGVEAVVELVAAIAEATGDEEVGDRVATVRSTAGKVSAGQPVTGWSELGEAVGAKVVRKAAAWLGVRRPRRTAPRRPKGESQADALVRLAAESGAVLFHDSEGKGYVEIPDADHTEVWPVRSKRVRTWLVRLFYGETKKAPGGHGIEQAIGVLEARGAFDGAEVAVHVRCVRDGGAVYLDLADERWRVVRVTARGWRVIPGTEAPVRFRRPRGARALPEPVRGGSLEELRELVNVPEGQWPLVVAWLVGALGGRGPYFGLAIHGEQGSAKTTLAELLRELVDPALAGLRAPPKEVRDLVISARNAHVIALDNLSTIPAWLSDALCRLATGGGFGARELYSDGEEFLIDAVRPILLNGISDLLHRPDLGERCLVLDLPAIPPAERRRLREVQAVFEDARPRILGALLDAVSCALRREAEAEAAADALPRMADAAVWATAAEPALGLAPGAVLEAIRGNQAAAEGMALEGDPVAGVVIAFGRARGRWEGTATELLGALSERASETVRRERGWPGRGADLGKRLKRLAPALRSAGLEVAWPEKGTGGRRAIVLAWRGDGASGVGAACSVVAAGRGGEGGGGSRSRSGPGDATREAEVA